MKLEGSSYAATSLLCDFDCCVKTILVPKCHCADRFNRVNKHAFFIKHVSQGWKVKDTVMEHVAKSFQLAWRHAKSLAVTSICAARANGKFQHE